MICKQEESSFITPPLPFSPMCLLFVVVVVNFHVYVLLALLIVEHESLEIFQQWCKYLHSDWLLILKTYAS